MIGWINSRLRKQDEGFTLVELMVVVLVIAILIAIAIPTFLGARERAQDRAVQSDLRNALTASKVWYVDNEDYLGTPAELMAIEPSLSIVATAGAASTTDLGHVAAATEVLFVGESESGTFFCIADVETTGTSYLAGTAAAVATVALCNGAAW